MQDKVLKLTGCSKRIEKQITESSDKAEKMKMEVRLYLLIEEDSC